MLKRGTLLWGVIVVFIAAGPLQAGITQWNPRWDDDSCLDPDNSGWSYDPAGPSWTIWEDYDATAPDSAVVGCGGEADSDPVLKIDKTITNGSTFVWTDYHIVISGEGVSLVSGSATSDTFGTIVEAGNVVDYYAPASVPIGGSVNVAFDIEIPAGTFDFTITQTPTPEPASLCLLAVGAAALLRRRRRES